MTDSSSPSVVIAGGGPAGLVAAILLGKRGIPVTVIERSKEPDPWSSKSYSIVLGTKGMGSLERAGALEAARQAGMKRECVIVHNAEGKTMVIPKQNSDSLGFSRPLLVKCLEKLATEQTQVTMKRGVGVSSVQKNDDGMMKVNLEDDYVLDCTHVIGADGKWSNVRASFPELEEQATIRTEPSFGVHIMADAVPKGWRLDGTHVIKPSEECMFHIIAAPIPTGELSISMVCYDETVERYPWLAPPEDSESYGNGGWEDEYSARPKKEDKDIDLADKLADLFAAELPSFLSDIGRESLATARINRRISWVEITADDAKYATNDGLVALIGDSAHAVVPTMGEGCNMAMESAVALVDSLQSEEGVTPTVAELSAAFSEYSQSRPKEVQPIQVKSAERSRWTKA